MSAQRPGQYSEKEARNELLLLDLSVRDQILTGDPHAAHEGEIGWNIQKNISARARELLRSP